MTRSTTLPPFARLAVLAVSTLLVGGLAGCAVEPSPAPGSTESAAPAESAAPIFASDEEALAAAVAAYERYIEVDALITSEGGLEPERIAEVTTEEYADRLIGQYDAIAKAGGHFEGRVTIDGTRLAQWNEEDGVVDVQVYLCVDVTSTRIFNASGLDVTPPDRTLRMPLLVTFNGDRQRLLVGGNSRWSGTDFC